MGRSNSVDKPKSSPAAGAGRVRNPLPRFSLRRFFCNRPSKSKSTSGMAEGSSSAGPPEPVAVVVQIGSSVIGASHQSLSRPGDRQLECPLCLQTLPEDELVRVCTCAHRSCVDCMQRYLRIEISESRINICCPECIEPLHPDDMRDILNDPIYTAKYEQFMLRRVLMLEPDTRWCPAPDCSYAVIATGCASCPRLKCGRQECAANFCYHCKQYWHPNQTCDAARTQRALRSSSASYSHDSSVHREDIKPCPRCGALIVKLDDGSCNHMTCTMCAAEFCWLCMKEISDLHYLSPSGCTFWGKKPWSRKKKLLWQLGTLVGAPLGIALVASVAIPAIIIGVPVWVGRRLHSRFWTHNKHKRNLIIAGGVTASILVSPLIAAFTVCVGVPVLLAYVYGVVPISLCRSGGCGGATDATDVLFEMEDEASEVVGQIAVEPTVTVPSAETAPVVNNPSIGPSIGEMSVGLTSSLSSHMERMGIVAESDRESASHRALRGSSLAGSISGGFQHRVEVQADINRPTSSDTNKRASLSSESATLSLDTKSGTVSLGDTASTKGLAGSLGTRESTHHTPAQPQETEVVCVSRASPVSSRSVSFCDETVRVESGKRTKRRVAVVQPVAVSMADNLCKGDCSPCSLERAHPYQHLAGSDVPLHPVLQVQITISAKEPEASSSNDSMCELIKAKN